MPEPVQPPEEATNLPHDLLDVASKQPARIDRRAGAALVTEHVFPTTLHTVRGWKLPWEYPNGRAVTAPVNYLAYAYRKSCASPRTGGRNGRRRAADAA
jgi:hypothetical protein